MKYRIQLWGYYPMDDPEKKFRKGGIIGGIMEYIKTDDFYKVEEKCREVWKKWTSQYMGTMIEIWVHPEDVYPPRIGNGKALFYKNNFEKFKTGSKAAMGTPF
jgi:hypothetical protein